MPSRERNTPRRIVVIGGVAAGMSFAARARRLDESAHIVVLERGDHVSFANCGLPYYVGGEIAEQSSLLVQTPESLRAALDLDVRVRHEATAIDPERRVVTARTPEGDAEFPYDELMLAPGAFALRPPIPGLDDPRVRTLRTVGDAAWMRDAAGAARRATVLGAGFIGVEAAEALRHRGLEVDIVEFAPHVLPPLETEMAALVAAELHANGVRVHAGVAASAIEDAGDHAIVRLSDDRAIAADLVVLSVGVRPDTGFAEAAGVATDRGAIIVDDHGRTSVPGIWAAGDAVAKADPVTGVTRPVALAGPANREGRLIADAMLGARAPRPMATPLGTAIVRVFGLTAALTGANRRSLEHAGVPFDTVHLHPGSHAGYFPGAETIHLVVHFAPASAEEPGRIYGAQAVGMDGVDKRIDVIATAMRAGLGVADLIDLDLSYSPPYGSAKDAVTMVGLVGQNVLEGTTRLWQPQDLDDALATALVLDVRRGDEWQAGHLPGALHVPHTELRTRMHEVRDAAAGRPVRVHCASGVRSYLAHRQLTAAGFDSATLSGGLQTLLAYHGKDILTHEVDHRTAAA
ncbi:FAD-dependent oxidoreductase [Microbacterium sp. LRZ72]|uniref:FAD-dependent oxidoreductase n=1 Tax=Microbacterium sp. LRZ72 TaxID=2942481 RepID=UPI0029A6473E|nr:FAD-dependent oxidoreductase [Microbacterium sp. LRZ72]MDX2376032.1 FAD-dependent oxidoreductase [Microbacterium sp. LRZ72]